MSYNIKQRTVVYIACLGLFVLVFAIYVWTQSRNSREVRFPSNFGEIALSRGKILDGTWPQWPVECRDAINGKDDGRRLLALSLISTQVELQSHVELCASVRGCLRDDAGRIYTPALEVLLNQPTNSKEFQLAKEAILDGLVGHDPAMRYLCLRIASKSVHSLLLQDVCRRAIASAAAKYGRDALFPPYAPGAFSDQSVDGKQFFATVLGNDVDKF